MLIAGGDSFTWGNELPDCTESSPSHRTWAALLAEQRSLRYACVAKPGAGNQAIARRVKQAVEAADSTPFVAVMWTFPSRREIALNRDVAEALAAHEYNLQDLDGSWLNLTVWQAMSFEEKIERFSCKDDPWFREKLRIQCEQYERYGIRSLAQNYFSLASEEDHRANARMVRDDLRYYLESRGIGYMFTDVDQFIDFCESKFDPTPMGHYGAEAHQSWLEANAYFK